MKRDMALIVGIGTPQKRSGPPPMPKRNAQEAQAEPYAAAEQPQPESQEMAEAPSTERAEHGGAVVTPEAVCFRSADEVCGNCGHMGSDGNCAVLGMSVQAGDSCNAFSQKQDAEMPPEDGEPEAPVAA